MWLLRNLDSRGTNPGFDRGHMEKYWLGCAFAFLSQIYINLTTIEIQRSLKLKWRLWYWVRHTVSWSAQIKCVLIFREHGVDNRSGVDFFRGGSQQFAPKFGPFFPVHISIFSVQHLVVSTRFLEPLHGWYLGTQTGSNPLDLGHFFPPWSTRKANKKIRRRRPERVSHWHRWYTVRSQATRECIRSGEFGARFRNVHGRC